MLQRWRALLMFAGLLAVLPLVVTGKYALGLAIQIGVNAIVCVGLNLLVGFAGQISLGHAAFFALGAYGAALLAAKADLPTWSTLPIVAVIVGLMAYAIARPILRLKGHYLAMATLGVGIIVALVLNREVWLTGGPDGLDVPTLRLFGERVREPLTWYYIVAAALLLAMGLARNLIDSPAGRALRALGTSEVAAETLGIDVARAKALVFTVSAVFAVVAGWLFAHAERFVTPTEAGFLRSVEFVTMVVLGGMSSTAGAVVGAAILTLLPHILAHADDYRHVLIGAILVGTMIFLPRGLVPSLTERLTAWRGRS